MTFWCLTSLLTSYSSVKIFNSLSIGRRSVASVIRGRLKSVVYSHMTKR